MSQVGLFTHLDCLEHDQGFGHPESPDRLRAVLAALEHPDFAGLTKWEAPPATVAQLELAHPPAYVGRMLGFESLAGRQVALDPDTTIGPGSILAARRAAGGVVAAVDAVMAGRMDRAFVAARPPGHHATAVQAMGFCVFSNAAIGALHARAAWGLARVAIVDFDVHHGNGTQDILGPRPGFLYVSSHQSPCYPGTGAASERGGFDNVVNLPLPPGSGSAEFRAAWQAVGLPALAEFAPELLIISAGFDAHRADPLAQLNLGEPDFTWITAELSRATAPSTGGRVVSLLEGGYDLKALATSAAAHVKALMAG